MRLKWIDLTHIEVESDEPERASVPPSIGADVLALHEPIVAVEEKGRLLSSRGVPRGACPPDRGDAGHSSKVIDRRGLGARAKERVNPWSESARDGDRIRAGALGQRRHPQRRRRQRSGSPGRSSEELPTRQRPRPEMIMTDHRSTVPIVLHPVAHLPPPSAGGLSQDPAMALLSLRGAPPDDSPHASRWMRPRICLKRVGCQTWSAPQFPTQGELLRPSQFPGDVWVNEPG